MSFNIFPSYFLLFLTNNKLQLFLFQALKSDMSLRFPGKLRTLKLNEDKNFLTSPYVITPPFLLHLSENKNNLTSSLFFGVLHILD